MSETIMCFWCLGLTESMSLGSNDSLCTVAENSIAPTIPYALK
jgi:hypothetical protein